MSDCHSMLAEYLLVNQIMDQGLIDTMIQPVVLTYTINIVGLKQLKGRDFSTSDEHWANFIPSNRTSPLSYTEMEYDYAVGPVADGNVFKIMMDLPLRGVSELSPVRSSSVFECVDVLS